MRSISSVRDWRGRTDGGHEEAVRAREREGGRDASVRPRPSVRDDYQLKVMRGAKTVPDLMLELQSEAVVVNESRALSGRGQQMLRAL